jgi:isopentenyl-diphosphate delta-isomerase
MSSISTRKKDHIDLTLNESSQYKRPTGFQMYQLKHNALPECGLDDISFRSQLLGSEFEFPLFISSMTGGHGEATNLNAEIATFCEHFKIPFGVGSQRVMLEDSTHEKSFAIVRKKAPNAFIAANIGGAQLIGGMPSNRLQSMINSIQANAVIVHLNPLQELIQPEGDTQFDGVLKGIEQLVNESSVPLIVKETGAGIDSAVAKRLLNVGVKVIDVAGVGGTSWSRVEAARISSRPKTDKVGSTLTRKYELEMQERFNEWGNSTVYCLKSLQELAWEREFEIIASGGIRHAQDMIKARCLGAHFVAVAQPVVRVLKEEGLKGLEKWFNLWRKEATMIMTLLGVREWRLLSEEHITPHSS